MENTEEKRTDTAAGMKQDNHAYLDQLAGELMGDKEWAMPPQTRFFLTVDLMWSLFTM